MKSFFVLLFLLLNINSIHAQHNLSLDSAVKQALENNPEIKSARARWQAKAKIPTQVSTLQNPTIGVRFKNVSFSEITLGEDPRTDIQGYFVQEIPFPTKLSSKRKIAEQVSESERWKAESVTRRVIAELKQQYFEWYFLTRSLEITNRNKQLLEKFVKTGRD